jgi:hypothetical protein
MEKYTNIQTNNSDVFAYNNKKILEKYLKLPENEANYSKKTSHSSLYIAAKQHSTILAQLGWMLSNTNHFLSLFIYSSIFYPIYCIHSLWYYIRTCYSTAQL